jgi:putative transposase
MPRPLRNIILNVPHHVTQRANDGERLFYDDQDHLAYLKLWHDRLEGSSDLSLWGFCLMPNHVHLILVPHTDGALSRTMQTVQSSFACKLNARYHRTGHRWRSRYHSTPMGLVHRWLALAYVENNPVKAKLVRQPGRWPWSSAAAHLEGHPPLLPLDTADWSDLFTPDSWRTSLHRCANKHLWNARLRLATRAGMSFDDTTPRNLILHSRPSEVLLDIEEPTLQLAEILEGAPAGRTLSAP